MTVRMTEEAAAAAQRRIAEAMGKPAPASAGQKHSTMKRERAAAAGRMSGKRERSTEAPDIEAELVLLLQRAGLGGYQRNYRFAVKKRYELDFAWTMQRVAIEVQGGLHSNGAHVRPAGYTRDCKKMRLAQLMDWKIFYCTAGDIRDNSIIEDVETALEQRRPQRT